MNGSGSWIGCANTTYIHIYQYSVLLYHTYTVYFEDIIFWNFWHHVWFGTQYLKLVKQMGNRVTAVRSTLRLVNRDQRFGGTHSLHLKGIKAHHLYSNSADTAKRMTRSAALSQPRVGTVNQHLFKGGTAILPDPTSNTISTCSPKCDLSLYQTLKEL